MSHQTRPGELFYPFPNGVTRKSKSGPNIFVSDAISIEDQPLDYTVVIAGKVKSTGSTALTWLGVPRDPEYLRTLARAFNQLADKIDQPKTSEVWVVFSTFYEGSGPPVDVKDYWRIEETEADAKATYDRVIEQGARSAGYAKIQEGTDWW